MQINKNNIRQNSRRVDHECKFRDKFKFNKYYAFIYI